MFELIRGTADRFLSLPSYGIAATLLFVLYAVQAEIRFGAQARATRSGALRGNNFSRVRN
jgi:hypothetical protein